jgi:hypothetical protein
MNLTPPRFERYLKTGSGRAFAKRHFADWRGGWTLLYARGCNPEALFGAAPAAIELPHPL